MEAVTRKPLQGVLNIIRFNWHFYVIAALPVLLLPIAGYYLNFWLCYIVAAGILASTLISLFVSYYVYDRSNLYDFNWLTSLNRSATQNIANIHAGFDETSFILKNKFSEATIHVFDFYDSTRHTEISIDRARRAYPAHIGTIKISTDRLPIADKSMDMIGNIFALHEVRDRNERVGFLKEQLRIMRDTGKTVVIEHHRDLPNFLAYNIGSFHFFSAKEWKANFQEAGFCIERQFKITPFVTVSILRKADGNTP